MTKSKKDVIKIRTGSSIKDTDTVKEARIPNTATKNSQKLEAMYLSTVYISPLTLFRSYP